MKALSLLQPWASLVAVGAKIYDTRSWATDYRGPIAIHASKAMGPDQREYAASRAVLKALYYDRLNPDRFPRYAHWIELPRGCVVAIALLTACELSEGAPPSGCGELEGSFGNFARGRWLWRLEDAVPIAPTPARGALGLWEWKHPLTQEV